MTVNGPMAMGLVKFSRGRHRNLVRDFNRESGFRAPELSMFHLVTTVICPFGTKVFTRLLPPKPNAIHSGHEVADGFSGYTSSGPSAGPPREPLMR